MLDERDDTINNVPIEEVDNVHIGDVVVDRVGFKDVESTLLTLKHFWNKDLLMLHLLSIAFEHFERKQDLGMHKNCITLL
jgi:hypothetical protein